MGQRGQIVNKRQLASILGTSERALTDLQRAGLPIAAQRGTRGQSNAYNTADVIDWLISQESAKPGADGALGERGEKARLTRLQADKLALEIAQLHGKLVPADKVEAVWCRHVSAARSAILSVPVRIAPRLASLASKTSEVQTLLERELHRALEKLAAGRGRETTTRGGRPRSELAGTSRTHAGGAE